MAIEVEYLKDGQGLLCRATSSIVPGEELIASVKEMYASPERVATLRFAIVDYSSQIGGDPRADVLAHC